MSGKAKKKTFADLFNSYKTYDPETEGYGNPDQWKGSFQDRMGLVEARGVLGDRSPYVVLGLDRQGLTWDVVKKAYRQLSLANHPDRAPEDQKEAAAARFRDVQAAYSALANEFGK